MFKREENPELFDYIVELLERDYLIRIGKVRAVDYPKSKYGSISLLKKNVYDGEYIQKVKSQKFLDDEIMQEIYELKICSNIGLKKLNGIEKCKKLTSFTLVGATYDSEIFNQIKIADNKNKISGSEYLMLDRIASRMKEINQVESLAPLMKCRHLGDLIIISQNKLTDIDLSNCPFLTNVVMDSCHNLTQIRGLSNLYAISQKKENLLSLKSINFNFASCDGLQDITDFDNAIQYICENDCVGTRRKNLIDKQSNEINIRLNANSFFAISNNHYKVMTNYVDALSENIYKDVFVWDDSGELNSKKINFTTSQMYVLQKKFKENEPKLFLPNHTKLEQVAQIYSFICSNFKYNTEMLEDLNRISDKLMEIKQNKGITHNENDNSNNQQVKDFGNIDALQNQLKIDEKKIVRNISSAYYTFLKNSGVCSGISNLFNAMLADIGIKAEICLCSPLDLETGYKSEAIATTIHQITRIRMMDENGIEQVYYFDPTWDLGKEHFNYFCLNKDEIKETHQLAMFDYYVNSAKSVQKELTNMGFLDNHQALKNKKLTFEDIKV